MSNPLVTVLLPVYNAEKFLPQALDSILGQTFRDFVLLVINDGSVDASEGIIKQYGDPRIVYLKNNVNLGLIATLNIGLAQVNTKYIIRMDADDISHLERFRLLVEFMEQNPDYGICGTAVGNLEGRVIGVSKIAESNIRAKHLLNCSITHATAIYRTKVLQDNGLRYNEKYKHAEDNDLITNIAKVSKIAVLNHKLYWVRKHENQVSNKYSSIQRASSNARRIELFKELTGVKLTEQEVRLYRALSYHEVGLKILDFEKLPAFTNKLLTAYNNQKQYLYDTNVLIKLLYRRVSLLYLKHTSLGFALFMTYVKNYSRNKNISIGLRLFLKTLLKRRNGV